MAYQITLDDEEYGILAAEVARRGIDLDPEQFLHNEIYKMQSLVQAGHLMTLHELVEKQRREGKIAYPPTDEEEELTQKELDDIAMYAEWFTRGKPLSEMIIEDRGPY
jgi:hypothetical protein